MLRLKLSDAALVHKRYDPDPDSNPASKVDENLNPLSDGDADFNPQKFYLSALRPELEGE